MRRAGRRSLESANCPSETLARGRLGDHVARASRPALTIALGAGVAVALQLVCFDQTPADSGAAPLIVGRLVSWVVVLTAALAVRSQLGAARPNLTEAVGAGILNAVAGAAFLLAVRAGDLAVVAVIAGLYPAGTVVLARMLLAERVGRTQLVGFALAAGAVELFAVG